MVTLEVLRARSGSLGEDGSAPALIAAARREKALRDALEMAEGFISNGIEFGFIRMPDGQDPACDTLPKIRKALGIES